MVRKDRGNERLVALVIGAGFALNLLFLFGDHGLLFGVPVLYLYLFVVWFVFIVLTALVMEYRPRRDPLDRSPLSESEARDA